ncbi:two-component sensor histidine kinase [Azospirillum fermentarium]|uniref:sensor histidine kinase n=1 Tax=Azospirillum fermentarium TaxID=1233114 RepID=UPI0022267352|nr:histidine kinase dimerization/phosphoacceptor domain -containing protein [Azospirillum fermentarium]MCW2247298.1 two-component sensor histidine kinase [Azospirillum fermentarium]
MPKPVRIRALLLPPDRPPGGGGTAGDPSPGDPHLARIQELESELRELQHRAKNSLQLVLSLLKLQAGRIRDPDARAAYEQTLVRIEALAILYRQLHETGSGTHVALGRYVEALCETVKAGTPGGLSTIPITVTAEAMEVGLYEAMPLGLIAAELVSNSLHHAFPDQGWIQVSIARSSGQRGRLMVEDNGRPLPAGFDTTVDDGLMLAEALAAQLGDTLVTETDSRGTTAAVSFPL